MGSPDLDLLWTVNANQKLVRTLHHHHHHHQLGMFEMLLIQTEESWHLSPEPQVNL